MKSVALSLLLLLSVAGCSGSNEAPAPEPQALVKVAKASQQTIGETVTLYGLVESSPGSRISLAAPIEARLVGIDAPTGSAVRKGQVILRLAPGPTAALDLSKARSDAKAADAAFARSLRLRADGLMSDADVETARAAKSTADATLQNFTGGGLVLRAPIAGYVENVTAAPGDVVAAGAQLASVNGNGPARAHFGVDPVIARSLKPGSKVRISRGGGAVIDARLTAVDPTVDPQSKLAAAYADIPGSASFRAGEPLTGEANVSGEGAGIVVPYSALLDDGGQSYVFVVVHGAAVRRDIVTGPAEGMVVAVRKGLAAGEAVVTEGGTALEDGMKVRLK